MHLGNSPHPGADPASSCWSAPGHVSLVCLCPPLFYIDDNSIVARKVTFFFSFFLLISVPLDSFKLPFLAFLSTTKHGKFSFPRAFPNRRLEEKSQVSWKPVAENFGLWFFQMKTAQASRSTEPEGCIVILPLLRSRHSFFRRFLQKRRFVPQAR